MSVTLRPAPMSQRLLAGAVDTALIAVLCAATFLAPLLLRGVVLPMWGVLTVMLGYSVLPLAFFHRTLGMALFGLELARKDGHPVDLANVLFRELLGRGFFPAAYLLTLAASLVASFLRVGGTVAPPVLTGVLTLASAAAVSVALVGHLVALGRPDQRTLADLIAGSFVVRSPVRAPPTDADELADWKAHRAAVTRNVVLVQVGLAVSVLALPWLLTSKGGETSQQRIARLKLESLEKKFEASPASASLAGDLQREYWALGRNTDADQVEQRHLAALKTLQAGREAELRERFAARPDRENASALLELLDRQGRVDDAEVVYRQWLGDAPTASARAGFGNWLATNGKTEAAVVELERALAVDPLVPFGHTLLGVSLQRLGRLPEAREHLELALLDDPEDEDAREALTAVEQTIGALPGKEKLGLQRRLDAWRRDAGTP